MLTAPLVLADSTSLLPATGASSIVTTLTDTVSDAWPIMAAGIGVAILVRIVRRFARS